MIWQDRIDNIEFTIITGDGQVYTPLWKNGQTEVEYNTSVFDFINVPGSLIERRLPKSKKYPLVFWFEGEDNITTAEAFQRSAEDSRPWKVTHPFYGEITGQPLSLSRNDVDYNITEVNVDFWETVTEDYPRSTTSITDNVRELQTTVLDESGISYANTGVLQSEDIQKNNDSITDLSANFESIQTSETKPEYENAVSSARSSNGNLLSNPLQAISGIQRLISLPSTYEQRVETRLGLYLAAYRDLNTDFESVADKLYFESQGAAILASYANAAVNTIAGDYRLRSEVERAVSDLANTYEAYMRVVDGAQVQIFDVQNAWMPNADVQVSLFNIVSFVVSSLFRFAFDAMQERTFVTPVDTNLFLMAHRFGGLDANDDNLQQFRDINNIKLNALFKIKKDTELKYFQ